MSNTKETMGTIGIVTHKIENPEWVFQFNNDEPVFLSGPLREQGATELTFTIGNTPHSNIVFRDNKGNEFKIFAREKQEGNNGQQ